MKKYFKAIYSGCLFILKAFVGKQFGSKAIKPSLQRQPSVKILPYSGRNLCLNLGCVTLFLNLREILCSFSFGEAHILS